MTDEDEEDGEADTPAVELGEGEAIEGAPLARVASRLTWPQEASRIREKEGESTIRTPDGPRRIDELLEEAGETYFESRQQFRAEIESVIGTGPVRPAE